MRFRPRLDTTQRSIVDALRKAGYSVRSLAAVGNGCPDILVGHQRGNVLLEAKSDRKVHKQKSHLSDPEKAFMRGWLGPVYVVFDAEQALAVMYEYSCGEPVVSASIMEVA